MRYLFFVFILSIFEMSFHQTSFAKTEKKKEKTLTKKKKRKKKKKKEESSPYTLYLSFRYSNWRYREPGLMIDYGKLWGVNLNNHFQKMGHGFFNLELEYLTGQTQYNGGLFDPSNPGSVTPHSESSENHILSLQGNYNILFTEDRFVLTLSAGIYIRGLINKDNPNSPYDYEREQYYYSLPLTGSLKFQLTQKLSLELQSKMHLFFSGKNVTHLEDVPPNTRPLTFKQDSGKGYYFSVSSEFNKFFIKIAYERWEVDDSEVNSGYLEPENVTDMTNLSLGYVFKY